MPDIEINDYPGKILFKIFCIDPPLDSSGVFIGYSIDQNAILEFCLNFYICFCAFWHFDIAPEKHYHRK